MKRFAFILILLCASVCCGDEYLGSWKIDDYVTITVTTHQFSTGAAYAATGNVLLDIYEDATDTEIVNDTTMSNFDSRTGLYQARVQLLTATGFEKGKHYTCVVAATVDGVAALWTANFQIEAEVDSQTNSGTVTPAAASITAATIASNAFTSDELDTTFIDEIYDDSLRNNKVKRSAGWWLQKGGGGDPLEITGTAQGGSANTIILEAGSSSNDGDYLPCIVELISGTGSPTNRTGVLYAGSTLTMTVAENWPGASPSSDTGYVLRVAPVSNFAAEGIAQSATGSTLTLASGDVGTDDLTGWLNIRSGTGSGTTVYSVTDSWDANDTLKIGSAWAGSQPDNTSYYVFVPTGSTASDTPTPSGLTYEEVEYIIDQEIGDANNTNVVGDIAALETVIEGILGDPNEASISADLVIIEAMVDSMESEIGSISGSYDLDALWDLCWDIWMTMP
ncbi:MAG: hypothetical protein ACYS8Z_21510 [Planctomycetota bacterium]|jgi:hypothetical protein